MSHIQHLHALEILDSRGRPTVQATCVLTSGAHATASVPSGASKGKHEARELRDGDTKRYRGWGCRRTVANIETVIAPALVGQNFETQAAVDARLLELDGTPTKERLGANALLAVSLGFARAVAQERQLPLYQYFSELLASPPAAFKMPRLTINLFSGGKHAGGQVAIQDVLMVPWGKTTDESLVQSFEVYQTAVEYIAEKYQMRNLTADEGGLAPPFRDEEAMLQDAMTVIERAGLVPGRDMSLAVDVAASHFYENGIYTIGGETLSPHGMIDKLAGWAKRYPIVSIEDGLAEEDWGNWTLLRERLLADTAGKLMVLGDDLLCTNPTRIRKAIELGAANALLLKVNQIGTLTEAAEARGLASAADWFVTVSARSGETEDNWLADLAVGWNGDQIKIGSITQSERLAKYNRLLAIEAEFVHKTERASFMS